MRQATCVKGLGGEGGEGVLGKGQLSMRTHSVCSSIWRNSASQDAAVRVQILQNLQSAQQWGVLPV